MLRKVEWADSWVDIVITQKSAHATLRSIKRTLPFRQIIKMHCKLDFCPDQPLNVPKLRSSLGLTVLIYMLWLWTYTIYMQGPFKIWTEHSNCPTRSRGECKILTFKVIFLWYAKNYLNLSKDNRWNLLVYMALLM